MPDPFQPDLSLWDPWTPEQVVRVLEPLALPWYIAAGWAIDLFLRRRHREHTDIEVAVPRERHADVAVALAGYDLFAAGVPAPGLVSPLEAGNLPEASHQTWVRERETGAWRLDVFAEPSRDETWIYRRDERVRLPFSRVIRRTREGIPYGCPEVVLLYKAKHLREKDEQDFATVLPHLDAAARGWLADALRLEQPGHAWLPALA